jgi:hypothetical protein
MVRRQVEADTAYRAKRLPRDRNVARRAAATTMMENGNVRKGIQAVTSIDNPTGPPPPNVFQAVEALFAVCAAHDEDIQHDAPLMTRHSGARRVLTQPDPEKGTRKRWTDVVRDAIKQLGQRSAAGPCGLRRDILLPLCGDDSVLAPFAELVDLALAGHIRDGYLTDSRLVLIPKRSGGA